MIAAASLWFVDTNVLLYEIDAADPARQAGARRWLEVLWENRAARLSWQVLNEFYSNATGKLGAPETLARTLVQTYTEWDVVDSSLTLLQRAWHWTDQAGVNYWDALILAAAERAGCRWILSEDFPHERKYGAMQVIDPFRVKPDEFFVA